MKKTVKINLSGIIFHLDEDAYEKLSAYLEKIHRHFRETKEGAEIISDIELRMTELFQSKLSDYKQVVTIEDVTEVIESMGEPEDFTDDEKKSEDFAAKSTGKKLYRDPDNSILGGVVGGIGAYLNIDPVWIRLIFVLLILAYGFTAVAYILLWIFVPPAKTYAQKLEMKGERVTISNIEKNVKREYEEVRGRFKKFQRSDQYKNMTNALNEMFQVLGKILKIFLKILMILIGICLILAGVAALFSILEVTFIEFPFPDLFDIQVPFYFLIKSLFTKTAFTLLIISLFLFVSIPLLFIIYGGVKLVTNFKANDKALILTGVIIWIAALLYLPGTIMWQVRNLGIQSYKVEEQVLDIAGTGNLMLQIDHSEAPEYYLNNNPFADDARPIQGIDREDNFYLAPSIDIQKSNDQHYRLRIKKISRGKTFDNASEYAEKINYQWERKDSTLALASHFKVPKASQYRIQHVEVFIKVPEGKQITIHEDAEEYLKGINNEQHLSRSEMGGKTWRMKADELILHKH
ncbi:MAG: PspC domain-containing protein [Bacteroidales bacterium]|nr:PspC domain-containing protein [Bacteroidales bacterium]MBS3775494.1 PspC domain-containing protein [Bacteroidales bacterium]